MSADGITIIPASQDNPVTRALMQRLDRMQTQIDEQQTKIAELEQRCTALQQPLTARLGGGLMLG